MSAATIIETAPASVDGVALHAAGERPDPDTLRQRACVVLLQSAARRAGLLGADEPAPVAGVAGEATDRAIEALLERELSLPEADEVACRRYHAAHAADFRDGDAVRARHVLFVVTPGVDVSRLRERAEATLLALRIAQPDEAVRAARFAKAAAECSNCPSAQAGGELGWISRDALAPEIARELFGGREVGVLPRLVHSRFGLHVFEVLERREGETPSFESVRPAVEAALRRQAFGVALRQYLRVLAADARVVGVELDAADSPLLN
jgi:peptidyl-prolyl cis-trans isomerase C